MNLESLRAAIHAHLRAMRPKAAQLAAPGAIATKLRNHAALRDSKP